MSLPVLSIKYRAFSQAGVPLNGGKLFSCVAGTATPLATYTDNSLGTPNTNPVILDANGEAQIWVNPGVAYKFILQDSLGVVQNTTDNYTLGSTTGGGGGGGTTASEWVQYVGAPTFVGVATFTVTGDQRATFAVGTRLKTINTAGTVYGTVTAVAFVTVTTVTVSPDSAGSLDSGLSVVYTGLLGVANPSAPSLADSAVSIFWSSAAAVTTSVVVTLGNSTMTGTKVYDVLGEFSVTTGIFTAKRSGVYRASVTWQPTPSGVTYSGVCEVRPLKNGSAIGVGAPKFNLLLNAAPVGNSPPQAAGSISMQLNAGDTIQFDSILTFSAGTNTYGAGVISIEKVG